MHSSSHTTVVIIGGGPTGLMAAENLAQAGVAVHLYDAMPSLGRKLLLAGKGGLNITHSEPLEVFLTRYPNLHPYLAQTIKQFPPEAIRNWLAELGIETFIGSSKRVYPLEMKSVPLMRAWLRRLRQLGVQVHTQHEWVRWDSPYTYTFTHKQQIVTVSSAVTLLALGGGSWPRLGSTGAWQRLLSEKNIQIAPLRPSNVGFEYPWSAYFIEKFAGTAIQSIRAYLHPQAQGNAFKGELTVSQHGLEGGLLYAMGAYLREQLDHAQQATFYLDLLPSLSLEQVESQLRAPRGTKSWSNFLRSTLRLSPVKISLMNEILGPQCSNLPKKEFAQFLKSLPIPLARMRPIEEAISSAGGISFDEVTEQWMLKKLPGVYCAGEMLDWDAPTGGYLLTACLAMGHQVAQAIIKQSSQG